MEDVYIRYKGIRQHVFCVLPSYASGFSLLVSIHVDQLHELFEKQAIMLAGLPPPTNLIDALLFESGRSTNFKQLFLFVIIKTTNHDNKKQAITKRTVKGKNRLFNRRTSKLSLRFNKLTQYPDKRYFACLWYERRRNTPD